MYFFPVTKNRKISWKRTSCRLVYRHGLWRQHRNLRFFFLVAPMRLISMLAHLPAT